MKVILWHLCLVTVLACATGRAAADVVIEDNGVSMSREELQYIVAQWSARMRQDAANDIGDRTELLNMALASKKIAAEADKLTPEKDGDLYWEKELKVRKTLQQFMVDKFIESIEPPDLSALAQERYLTEKDKYAWVPPQYLTSHILWLCVPKQGCNARAKLPEAQKVLDELRAGADFGAMVAKYSQDPGSKGKGGRFDQWLSPRQEGVDPAYVKGAFSIENKGEYSDVVVSQFGLHILRLDDVRESYYKPYEEVKLQILRDLAQEYAQLSIKIFDEGYRFSDQLSIDGDAMEEIFAPYKAAE